MRLGYRDGRGWARFPLSGFRAPPLLRVAPGSGRFDPALDGLRAQPELPGDHTGRHTGLGQLEHEIVQGLVVLVDVVAVTDADPVEMPEMSRLEIDEFSPGWPASPPHSAHRVGRYCLQQVSFGQTAWGFYSPPVPPTSPGETWSGFRANCRLGVAGSVASPGLF